MGIESLFELKTLLLLRSSYCSSLEIFLISRLAEHDARDAFELLVVDHETFICWVQLLGLLKVFDSPIVLLEGFEAKGAPEISIGVFGILDDHHIEVLHRFLVLVNHLISLCSFVDIPDVSDTWHLLDALLEGEN